MKNAIQHPNYDSLSPAVYERFGRTNKDWRDATVACADVYAELASEDRAHTLSATSAYKVHLMLALIRERTRDNS